ncbi:MAG: hypothetical protein AMJ60_04145 [Desulfobacterales bacterium SG8_35]|nr:MAG: hypothetical protein AMJ60_04145 [Desulfobacterales bacterium SG8_35]
MEKNLSVKESASVETGKKRGHTYQLQAEIGRGNLFTLFLGLRPVAWQETTGPQCLKNVLGYQDCHGKMQRPK